ncbi:helix-turn-helix domain-containing protein [Enterovirga aerilata]|uniref:Helix-turn-helix transcriptional regulator n=1 Tax=Enterovirga aerilata TaxID=2730920 RepID=A0A849I4N2_9HYPH|nr:helix-turn-helix transcriptional regulator [Enterovirga sp. DB1703]NNM74402.1 helix-turn-helix transcriptional regulator [Enterovirga sp. DB1703]
MVKAPNDVDRQVGSRVRMRRMLIGMSQEKLGDALGLTFQQVQKYEKGTNRISASRLQQIAQVLGVSIDFLYGEAGKTEAQASGFAEDGATGYDAELLTSDSLKLLRAYREIKDRKVRRRLVELAQALAERGREEAD